MGFSNWIRNQKSQNPALVAVQNLNPTMILVPGARPL